MKALIEQTWLAKSGFWQPCNTRVKGRKIA
jgi:hypothetical protein